jgi:hypothetical protein
MHFRIEKREENLHMRLVKHLCLILVFLCALPIAALAQMGGSIDGSVTDPNGAVIAGAKVTATGVTNGRTIIAATTQAGLYAFTLLPVGPYTITVTQAGFKTFVRTGIEVRVGLSETIDIQMELGTVQQTVNVKAQADVLEVNTATRGTNLSPQTMDNLPVWNGGSVRLAINYQYYMPGVNNNGEYSINGSTGRSSEIMIDGGSTVSPESGGTSFYFAGFEAFGEYKILTSGFTAENGRVGGGVQELVTKSGTNDFHGSAFFNFERQTFNSVPWATNATQNQNKINAPCIVVQAKACRPKARYNDEGGAAGGPIVIPHVYNGRNKSFFYFTYEGYWQPASVSAGTGYSMPTAAMVQGNFAGLAPIYDPATTGVGGNAPGVRSQFPNNVIPTTRFSAISKNILPYLPAPNALASGSVNPQSDYVYNNSNITTDHDWSIKVDHTIRTNHHIAFFYTHRVYDINQDMYAPGPLSDGVDAIQAPHQWRLSHDWVVNPHVLLHNYLSLSNDNTLSFSLLQKGYGCKFGFFSGSVCGTWQDVIPVISFSSDLTMPAGTGNITSHAPCGNCETWGQNQGAVDHKGQTNHIYMFGQTLSDVRGKHEFKMGWEERKSATFNDDWAGSNGVYVFDQAQTEDVTGHSTTGESFASFLLGAVNKAGGSGLPALRANVRYSYTAGFFQDTWRVRPRLTVNLGFRYEIPIGWHFATNQFGTTYSAFSPTLPNPQAAGLPGGMIFPGSGPGHTGSLRPYPTDYSDIGPRAGVAIKLTSKTVIRSAFGLFYEGVGNGGCGCTDGYGGGSWDQTGNGFDPTFQWDGTSTTTPGTHPPATFKPAQQYPGVDNFNGGTPYFMGPHFGVAPRIYDGNFTVQHQYKNWLFEAGYVGNRTHGANSTLYMNTVPDAYLPLMNTPAPITGNGVTVPAGTNLLAYNFNTPAQATILNALGYYSPSGNGSLNPTGIGWNTPWTTGWGGGATLAQSLRPYPHMGNVNSGNSGDGWLSYDSLQVKVEHRFGDLNFEGSYVRSKTLDVMSYRQIFSQGAQEQTQDTQNIKGAKALAIFDMPNVVAYTFNYALPFGRGKHFLGNSHGAVNKVVGGWNVAALGHYGSGGLIELTSTASNLATYMFEAVTRANDNGVPVKTNISANSLQYNNPASRWFNTSTNSSGSVTGSASYTANVAGTWGTAALYQNHFRNPWQRTENISINKTVGIYGEGRVYLRYQISAFNPFNRHAMGGVNGTINSSLFGVASGPQVGSRNISMGLRLYF